MDASHEESKRWSSLGWRETELNQAIVDVSQADFLVGNFDLKSHRNRFTILLARTAHIAYHLGQAKLSERVQT